MQRLFRNLKTLAVGLCAAGAVTLASAQGAAPINNRDVLSK